MVEWYEEEIFNPVYNVVRDVYEDCGVSEEDMRGFAEDLVDSVFYEECPLNDILAMSYCFEEQLRADGIEIDIGLQGAVYSGVLGCLERNAINAKRVYDSFIEYSDVAAFFDLMDEYCEWLTQEEIDNVLEIAKVTFIESVWKAYI